jgi:UDP-glucose 4-epimerase
MEGTMSNPTALVTGGAGFIGSHCCVDLLANGFDVVVVDNFSNSSPAALDRVREIGGSGQLTAMKVDLLDESALQAVFDCFPIDVVIHFAAFKAVDDSLNRPLEYYTNNVAGLLNLLNAMSLAQVKHLVFSSTCAIYGDTGEVPLTELSTPDPTNPYARSKWMGEQILEDICTAHPDWSVTALRYFNPVGAHESGQLGEDPAGIPGNIMPLLAQVAAGRIDYLNIFGADYSTSDGTAIRDYVHVMDVVEGHRLALENGPVPGFRRFNLGTGVGTSVLGIIRAFEQATGEKIPYRVAERRPGDVSELVASPALAQAELRWNAKRILTEACRDAWQFQMTNPSGHRSAMEEVGNAK